MAAVPGQSARRRATGLLCLAALALIGCGGGEEPGEPEASEPREALRTFQAAAREGDGERACTLLTEAAERRLAAEVGARCPRAVLESPRIAAPALQGRPAPGEVVRPGQAILHVRLGAAEGDRLRLTRERGRWRLATLGVADELGVRIRRAGPLDDAASAAHLIRLRYRRALALSGVTVAGETAVPAEAHAEYRRLEQAWQRYLELADLPELGIAYLVADAQRTAALHGPSVRTHLIITELDPSKIAFLDLARAAYAAGDQALGDSAGERAVELSEPSRRESMRRMVSAARERPGQGVVEEGA